MWSEGTIGVPASVAGKPTAVHYWVKHYKNPSKYGINNGRISKVKYYKNPSKYGINNGRISKVMLKIDGEIVCNYDRGWDVRPTCKAAEVALEILLYEYDGRNEE